MLWVQGSACRLSCFERSSRWQLQSSWHLISIQTRNTFCAHPPPPPHLVYINGYEFHRNVIRFYFYWDHRVASDLNSNATKKGVGGGGGGTRGLQAPILLGHKAHTDSPITFTNILGVFIKKDLHPNLWVMWSKWMAGLPIQPRGFPFDGVTVKRVVHPSPSAASRAPDLSAQEILDQAFKQLPVLFLCELGNDAPRCGLSWVRAGVGPGCVVSDMGICSGSPSRSKRRYIQPVFRALLFHPINCISKASTQRSLFLWFQPLTFTT